jgi:predicted enzyme related to lactoylglutathione lyase
MTSENDRRIDYIEFGAADLPATKRFYQQAFGWTFTDFGPAYTSFDDGRLAGGFDGGSALGRAPLVVIYAADLAAARTAVAAAGARVFNEHAFPGGRRFHFIDPAGNELAVWSEN